MKNAIVGILVLLTIFGIMMGLKAIVLQHELNSSASPPPINQFSPQSATLNDQSVTWKVEEVARGLEIPWSIVWTSPTRMLVTERTGTVRVVENGQLQSQPLYTFSEVATGGEEGLMGMALDPQYSKNSLIYFSYAYHNNGKLAVKIVRLKDIGTTLSEPKTLLDGIPAAANHAGNRLHFGPDGKLYSSTGDASDRPLAQKLDSLAGKILRFNPDGSIPEDNPFSGSYVYSYGHRNPQGFDWQPGTNTLFETEHGPSVVDGPAGGDEVNIIKAGENYGWPLVSHNRSRDGLISPILLYTPAEAPASGMFYRSHVLPQYTGNFLFGALKGEGIIRLQFKSDAPSQIQSQEKLFTKQYGRIRDVAEGPEGAIYFATSNRDGRGTSREGDDKIYRIMKKE